MRWRLSPETLPGTTSEPGLRLRAFAPGCLREHRRGEGVPPESRDCVVWSDGEPIVLYGAQDLVVVHAHGRILIMPTDRAPDMKWLLDALPAEIRDIDA